MKEDRNNPYITRNTLNSMIEYHLDIRERKNKLLELEKRNEQRQIFYNILAGFIFGVWVCIIIYGIYKACTL
jgi:hypothetical protein